ncbi:MAG: SAM-dependent methyltransferase [Proteobacteria bacterium]|nr:MAG: SAM-dependent methyltransferase [Pseudomonadota bacterium]
MLGKLWLIPNTLSEGPIERSIPEEVRDVASGLTHFFVESEKGARAFLKRLPLRIPIQDAEVLALDDSRAMERMLDVLRQGRDAAILSDAGLPCVADPGAQAVLQAHRIGAEVKPLVGPCSILLALMGSGLNGQSFAFCGYLPVEKIERERKIRELEQLSSRHKQTQIFMETPYRSQKLFESLLETCSDGTWLSVAANLTSADQTIGTRRVAEWKNGRVEFGKAPCIFCLSSLP